MIKKRWVSEYADCFSPYKRHLQVLSMVLAMLPNIAMAQKITAEMVLGDYRSDPLFGEASPGKTVSIIIENDRLTPAQISVINGKTIRLLISNESKSPHLIVATNNIARVLANEAYILSFHDESAARLSPPGTHTHSSGSSVKDASPIVRTAEEDPALYISSGDTREMLIKVLPSARLDLFCVLDEHYLHGFQTKIMVDESE